MRHLFHFSLIAMIALTACQGAQESTEGATEAAPEQEEFQYLADKFADLKIIRYQVPGFDKLTLKQKMLAYYLHEASLAGRDIIWDQNYRHNLKIRRALENIVANYKGEEDENWENFMVYTKRVWFSNGIHHHYGMNKFNPEFDRAYFEGLMSQTGTELSDDILEVIFNPEIDAKRVNLDPAKGLVKGSANNFYDSDITEAEVDAFYAKAIDKEDETPISYGLNSKMVRNADGAIEEQVYKIDGLYGPAIAKIVQNLEKAIEYAESEDMKKGFELLIEYYKTGSLETWDDYNIQWTKTTGDVIDYINGFIEVYGDSKGYRGTYESIIEMEDFEASARMKVLSDNVQWFEDNSSIMDEHKKKEVVGVSYKVINAIVEAGDAAPSTPIGVNLPNANWIRANHGSKSVSLGNIVEAYSQAGGKDLLKEFTLTEEEYDLSDKHGKLASKLHTALHEVVGHASGQLEKGVPTPKETLKNYSSTLEEGRADLVALYFIMDQKMVDLGLMESLDVGKAEYDSYIRNGLMLQLRRLEPGEVIEEAHMRNRQLIAAWCYEKGMADNVIEKVQKDGKTYFRVNDYEKLRVLFGDLLKEIQRIKSQGDYEAGSALVENYGVQVDQELHAEVLERSEKLNIAPYGGFIQPQLAQLYDENGEVIDVRMIYPDDFVEQMMHYGKNYSFLP